MTLNWENLYKSAEEARARLKEAGLETVYAMHSQDYEERGSSGGEVTLKVGEERGKFLYGGSQEKVVERFLEAFPDTALTYEKGYGSPEMKVRWVSEYGDSVELDFGYSACEKKQVGTKTVLQYRPEDLEKLEKVEVEEPVYDYFCTDDPLAGL